MTTSTAQSSGRNALPVAISMICVVTKTLNKPESRFGEEVRCMQNEDLSRYLWKGLNLKRYSVVRIIPQDAQHAVIIMFSNDRDDPHWCL